MSQTYDLIVKFTLPKSDIPEAEAAYGNLEELHNALALWFRSQFEADPSVFASKYMVQSVILDGEYYPIKKKY